MAAFVLLDKEFLAESVQIRRHIFPKIEKYPVKTLHHYIAQMETKTTQVITIVHV